MHLIQILLPLYDNHGRPFPRRLYRDVRNELLARFEGLTAFTQAPATGLWKEEGEQAVHDELVIYEVMAWQLDRDWWQQYRAMLEKRFAQDELVVRLLPIERL
ncbi:hypothetical protein [Stutzerimonas azotifigens]|uniref:hypothetical protein n=1 Tax=Stutzerimonas azotifigens TaxID=291995 RepID=UPI000411F4AA|nr:hypothetical protein [Stutzerimonas azotifigens]